MHVEEAIIAKLMRSGPGYLHEIVTSLPWFTWSEVFVAVELMSRDGRVSLRQLGGLTYQIVLRSQFRSSSSPSSHPNRLEHIFPFGVIE